MEEKKQKGGARPGAGRKPTGTTLIAKTIRMPQESWDSLAKEGRSYRAAIENILKKTDCY